MNTRANLEQELIRVASRSPCMKRKVGAVVACDKVVDGVVSYYFLSAGFNHNGMRERKGLAGNVPEFCVCEDKHGKTLDTVIHAEIEALSNWSREAIEPWDYSNTMMYVTHEPCTGCQAAIAARGIKYTVIKHTEEQRKNMQVQNTGLGNSLRPGEPDKLQETLKERGSVYGTFQSNAYTTQAIMSILLSSASASNRVLDDFEREALHMVAHKMSRIVNGQRRKKDNWHDIGGYARCAEDLTQDT